MTQVGVRQRAQPLEPCAVLATGSHALPLVERLLTLASGHLARLRGVGGDGLVLVCGQTADLPWSEGVQYLGRDAAAPRLLVPTALELLLPNAASSGALLERALARHFSPAPAAPWALSFAPPLLIPAGNAQTLSTAGLLIWVKTHTAGARRP